MFFVIRFNASFAALGIDPSKVPVHYREIGQVNGQKNGCTPQEAVILTLGGMPMDYQIAANPSAAMVWIKDGKINIENRAIQQALLQIGWERLIP